MRAAEVAKRFEYRPDELVLQNVLSVGDFPEDDGAEVGVVVSLHGTMISIEGEVAGQTALLILSDEQFDELTIFYNQFRKEKDNE